MASLIVLGMLSNLLAHAVPSRPLQAAFVPQRLTSGEIASAKAILREHPDIVPNIMPEQSFKIDTNTWTLGYVLPAPGGRFQSGEIGVAIIRDGRAVQLAHTDERAYHAGLDAISFLDVNNDGLKDIVTLYRTANRAGLEEFVHVGIYVARKTGIYAYDPQTSFVASGDIEHPVKTIADVRARLKEAAKPPKPEPPPPPTHSYKLDGELNDKARACLGKAFVKETTDGAGARCIEWTLQHVKCKGKGDGDWLYRNGPDGASDSICLKDGEWIYPDADSIPGRGTCEVVIPEESKKAKIPAEQMSFRLNCDWTCRGEGRDACSGAANYDFTPLPAAKP